MPEVFVNNAIECAGKPPQHAEPTGEVVRWGRDLKTVYRMDRRKAGDDYLAEYTEVVPVRDDAGKPVWNYHPNGQPIKIKTHRVVRKEFQENPELYYFEFIIVNGGDGMERMERNFRPSPDDKEREEAARLSDPAYLLARMEQMEAERRAAEAALHERLDKASRAMAALGVDAEAVEQLTGGGNAPEPRKK